jgi:hypothetical protein
VVVTVGDRRIVHPAQTAAADSQRGLAASRIAKRTTGKAGSGFEASCQRITHAEASPAGRLWPPDIALLASQSPVNAESDDFGSGHGIEVRNTWVLGSGQRSPVYDHVVERRRAVVLARHFRGPMSSRISRSPGAWVDGRRRSRRANEPVLVVEHDGERETSLASEPQLLKRPHLLLVHTACVRDRRIAKASMARAR